MAASGTTGGFTEGDFWAASLETTSPAELIRLAGHPDGSIRYALAENPATPGEALALLAQSSDWEIVEQVLRHPNIPRDEVEPALLRLFEVAPHSAIAHPAATEVMFDAAVGSGDVRVVLAALANPACPASALGRLERHSASQVRFAVAHHRSAGPHLGRMAGDPSASVRAAVAAHPAIDEFVANLLARDSSTQVLYCLRHNEAAPDTWRHLAGQRLAEIERRNRGPSRLSAEQRARQIVGQPLTYSDYMTRRDDPVAAVRVVAKLVAYETGLIAFDACLSLLGSEDRGVVAKSLDSIDPVLALPFVQRLGLKRGFHSMLRRDWRDSIEVARLAIAGGDYEHIVQVTDQCPLDESMLDALADLPPRACYVRILSRHQYPMSLTGDGSYEWFRPAVVAAVHTLTGEQTLERLRHSRDVHVRVAMVARMESWQLSESARGRREVRVAIACHPKVTADTLEELADDVEATVRAAVAGNRRTPAEYLARLAYDPDAKVRAAVAANPSASDVDRVAVALQGGS